jgi:hypothetical protein
MSQYENYCQYLTVQDFTFLNEPNTVILRLSVRRRDRSNGGYANRQIIEKSA